MTYFRRLLNFLYSLECLLSSKTCTPMGILFLITQIFNLKYFVIERKSNLFNLKAVELSKVGYIAENIIVPLLFMSTFD